MKRAVLVLALALVGTAHAQQSSSFQIGEHVLNAGGHPAGGNVLSSATHRVSLDAVGEGVIGPALGSPSFLMDGGFVSAYPPPGEVRGLVFISETTLEWSPEKSTGDYNLYRDLLGNLPGLGFGVCLQSEVAAETASDPEDPAAGSGFFYLVTAENRLDEEGTKGFGSDGSERGNPSPCP